jgi:hypothetical protein
MRRGHGGRLCTGQILKIVFIRIKFSNTKRHDHVDGSRTTYSGGPEVISRPEYQLSLFRILGCCF